MKVEEIGPYIASAGLTFWLIIGVIVLVTWFTMSMIANHTSAATGTAMNAMIWFTIWVLIFLVLIIFFAWLHYQDYGPLLWLINTFRGSSG